MQTFVAEGSLQCFTASMSETLKLSRNEPHDSSVASRLNWLRAGVLGANDGIVSVAATVVGVALLMGFRSGASVAAWLAVVGILALFTLALTWIAVIAGLLAKTVDGASGFSYPLIFLPFISSAFVPTGSMPGPVAWFAENQPVTSIVDAIRALLAQEAVGSGIWTALAWLAGLLVAASAVAAAVYRRKFT